MYWIGIGVVIWVTSITCSYLLIKYKNIDIPPSIIGIVLIALSIIIFEKSNKTDKNPQDGE
jgi:hypothetical protein